jgi:hypothetical protein
MPALLSGLAASVIVPVFIIWQLNKKIFLSMVMRNLPAMMI